MFYKSADQLLEKLGKVNIFDNIDKQIGENI